MFERLRDKRVDPDRLNTNFPCMMACPAGTNAGRVRFAHCGRTIRGGVLLRPGSKSDGERLRPRVRTPLRDRLLPRRHRSTNFHPRLEALSHERYGPDSRRPLPPKRCSVPNLCYKIAIVGSGPAGLSAAHDLALMGYFITIFEAAQVAGGMLHLGIPEYRLRGELSMRRFARSWTPGMSR